MNQKSILVLWGVAILAISIMQIYQYQRLKNIEQLLAIQGLVNDSMSSVVLKQAESLDTLYKLYTPQTKRID